MAERVGFEPTRHCCLRALQARLIVHSSTSPLAERVGFEPTAPINEAPLFESGSINHSDTSPWSLVSLVTIIAILPPAGKGQLGLSPNMIKKW